MGIYKDLREFYETTLKPDLEIIDRERKMVNRRVFRVLLITVALIILEILLIPPRADMLKAMVPMLTGFAGLVMTKAILPDNGTNDRWFLICSSERPDMK